MTTELPPHCRDTNNWDPLPDTEVERLQKTLAGHAREMNISMKKPERISYIKKLLTNQHQTCALGKNVNGAYCWNGPVDKDMTYLKLQWGHTNPRCRQEEQTLDDLCLMCARCNNQIQTSRHLYQLKAELLSKIEHIDEMITMKSSPSAPLAQQ